MRTAAVIVFLSFLIAALFLKGRHREPETGHLQGTAMALPWRLEWRSDDEPPADLSLRVAAVLEQWEQVMSKWRADSDASRYNRGEPPTPDLARVLERAEQIRAATGGAFDHRLLEQVHAAGFGPAGRGIDLSSIGEGFAADRVADELRAAGIRDFIFEIGGEVVAGDGDWPVGIEVPDPETRAIARTVVLRNQALSTSGNYRQYLRGKTGELRGHIIDPKTGQPVIRPPSSVTVIAPDCATAGSWATALFVLGPDYRAYPPELTVEWQILPARTPAE